METESGTVYILTNKAMPGLVKIGKTSRDKVEIRMNELYSTGVPLPFQCAFAGKVDDMSKVEKAFHKAFGPYRVNKQREFFQIDPDQAIGLLELMSVEDMTPQIMEELEKVDQDSKDAVDSYRLQKRPNLDLFEMGIPEGSVLIFTDTGEECHVVSNKKVNFRNELMSLSRATGIAKGLPKGRKPGPYWTFEGKLLKEIYSETYDDFE